METKMTEQNTRDDLVGKLVRGEIESNLDKKLKEEGFRPFGEATIKNGKIELSSYLGIDEFYLGQTDLRLVDVTSLGIFDERVGERFVVYAKEPKEAKKHYSMKNHLPLIIKEIPFPIKILYTKTIMEKY